MGDSTTGTQYTIDMAKYNLAAGVGLQILADVPYAFRKSDSIAAPVLLSTLEQPLLAYSNQLLSNRTVDSTDCDNFEPSITDLAQNTGMCTVDSSIETALTLQNLGLGFHDSARFHNSYLLFSSLDDADKPPITSYITAATIPALQLTVNPVLGEPVDWNEVGHATLASGLTLGQARLSHSARTDLSFLFLDSSLAMTWHHKSESLIVQAQIAERKGGPAGLASASLGSMFLPATIGASVGTEAFTRSTENAEKWALAGTMILVAGSGVLANTDEGALAMLSAPAGIATGVGANLSYHYVLKPYIFEPVGKFCHRIFNKD